MPSKPDILPADIGLSDFSWFQEPEYLGSLPLPHTLELPLQKDSFTHPSKITIDDDECRLNSPDGVLQMPRLAPRVGPGVVYLRQVSNWLPGSLADKGHPDLNRMTIMDTSTPDERRLLVVGRMLYYRLGISANIVVVQPNPEFDSDVAKANIDEIDFGVEPLKGLDSRGLLENVDFDPAAYLAETLGAKAELRGPDLQIVSVGQGYKDDYPRKIYHTSQDLVRLAP